MYLKLDFNIFRVKQAKIAYSFSQEALSYVLEPHKMVLKQSRWQHFHGLRFLEMCWCCSEMFDRKTYCSLNPLKDGKFSSQDIKCKSSAGITLIIKSPTTQYY